jgi:methylenetetrahydrofolate dehydrogenase (NADP+)/methenyltetrahydrofolate cyclohydrolase
MLDANATVTICHNKTNHLESICKSADILVAAIGKPKFINSNYIKDSAVVIDVGINRDENGKLCGDVDFEDVKDKVYAITPVPGGVGPMTVYSLIENTIQASR